MRGNHGAAGGTGQSAELRVCLGVVGAPHGVAGAVRIKSYTDEPAAIARYGALEDESGGRRFTLRVVGAAKGDGMVIATLSGVADRDRAEALRGLQLYLPRAALPAPKSCTATTRPSRVPSRSAAARPTRSAW